VAASLRGCTELGRVYRESCETGRLPGAHDAAHYGSLKWNELVCRLGLTSRDTPIITVVMAVRNALEHLQQHFDSWERGLPAEAELVIIDGGSTDGSREWLDARSSCGVNARLTVIAKDDSTIAEAWNNAVPVASGDWLLFMGADDRIPAVSRWEEILRTLGSRDANVDACMFPVEVVSRQSRHLDVVEPSLSTGRVFDTGISRLPHQGVFHRRSMWREYGPYDTTYAIAADYEFLVRARARGARFEIFRDRGPVQMTFGGISTRSPLGTLLEYRRAHRAHGVAGNRLAWIAMLAISAIREALIGIGLRSISDSLSDFVRSVRGRQKVWTTS